MGNISDNKIDYDVNSYYISKEKHITIGNASNCTVYIEDNSKQSNKQINICRIKDGWMIEKNDYTDDSNLESGTAISYGYVIRIPGVNIILFKDFMVVRAKNINNEESILESYIKEDCIDRKTNKDNIDVIKVNLNCIKYKDAYELCDSMEKEKDNRDEDNICLFNRAPRIIREECIQEINHNNSNKVVVHKESRNDIYYEDSVEIGQNNESIEIEHIDGFRYKINRRNIFQIIKSALGDGLILLVGILLLLVAWIFRQVEMDIEARFRTAGVITCIGFILVMSIHIYICMLNENRRIETLMNYAKAKQISKVKYRDYVLREICEIDIKNYNQTYESISKSSRYCKKSKELWNRRSIDKDDMVHRIGIGTMACIAFSKEIFSDDSINQMTEGGKKKLLHDNKIPMCIDFRKYKVVGIVGKKNRELAERILYALVGQIASNNCYTDVKMVFAYDKRSTDWSMTKWLPHIWSEDGKRRYLADCDDTAKILIREITDECNNEKHPEEYFVIFVSKNEYVNGIMPSVNKKENCKSGYTFVVLEDTYELLPHICDIVIQKRTFVDRVYYVNDNKVAEVTLEGISAIKLEKIARRLSRIRIATHKVSEEKSSTVSFLDLFDVGRTDNLGIEDRWKYNDICNGIAAPIGRYVDNEDNLSKKCILNIHEKKHGPHGIIAGPTGSGKSELMQTFLLSLAVNYSPEELNFFLLDFKGGCMANKFRELPHVGGIVTNLNKDYIKRAISTLRYEIMRREKLFVENDVNNIDEYIKKYRKNKQLQNVSHILVVVDEFAEIKREGSELMDGLISVAQLGRSLGIHLLLSTQRELGSIEEDIWNNIRYKICLSAVEASNYTEEDSNNIVGRGFFRVGKDEIFEKFQAGWSMETYAKQSIEYSDAVRYINDYGRFVNYEDIGGTYDNIETEQTQFSVVSKMIIEYFKKSKLKRAKSLWKDVLANKIYIEDILVENIEHDNKEKNYSLNAIIGMCDDIKRQKQYPLSIDFVKDGSAVVCGSRSSGKSFLIKTLIFGLLHKYNKTKINIDIIDFSNMGLAIYNKELVVENYIDNTYDNVKERVGSIINNVKEEYYTRRKMAGASKYEKIADNKCNYAVRLIIIDNYESFRDITHDRFEEDITMLVREGGGYGLFFVISANKIGMDGIPNRITENIKTICCLHMVEKYQYCTALKIGDISFEPKNTPGRGVIKQGDCVLEFQIALVGKEV